MYDWHWHWLIDTKAAKNHGLAMSRGRLLSGLDGIRHSARCLTMERWPYVLMTIAVLSMQVTMQTSSVYKKWTRKSSSVTCVHVWKNVASQVCCGSSSAKFMKARRSSFDVTDSGERVHQVFSLWVYIIFQYSLFAVYNPQWRVSPQCWGLPRELAQCVNRRGGAS